MLAWIDLFAALNYNPQTGEWNWIKKTPRRERVGRCDKFYGRRHRRVVTFQNTVYFSHRLAWFYMTGRWPKEQIDHRDSNSDNNSWTNLREATNRQNSWNRQKSLRAQSIFKGVHWHKRDRRWEARITINGKTRYLGTFKTAKKAREAYITVAKKHFGEFARA